MLSDFEQILATQLTLGDILLNISTALICGLLITAVYRATYKGPGYSVAFLNAMILLAMITSIVLMVIGNNLARAFGLVGAMSIIRFRTAVKDTQDIVFIFFSLAVGMAAGVGYHLIAICGTIFIGLTMLALSAINSGSTTQREFLLQFSYSPNGSDQGAYLPVIKKYCKKYRVINVSSPGNEEDLEISYYITLKRQDDNDNLIRDLRREGDARSIQVFFDEDPL